MKKFFLAIALCFLAMMGLNAQTVNPDFQDGFLYVKLVDSYPLNFRVDVDHNREIDINEIPFLKATFEKYGVVRVAQDLFLFNDTKLLHTLCVSFTQHDNVNAFIDELQQFKQIEYAEQRPIKHISMIPNDPYYMSYYGYNFKWHLEKIKGPDTWDIQTGDPSIIVAIVDNAVYGAHEDLGISSSYLASITWSGYSPSTSTGSADPPASATYNYTCSENDLYYNNNCPAYDWSHGTHCAGLVGAKLNNGVGVASIGGGVTLMGVRTANNDGSMYATDYGVQWAANHGAKVISMSFGSTQSSTTESNLMQTCYNSGIILVAAAGNEGDQGNAINYPGGYSTVISVASINNNGKLSYFSQYGSGRADIAAPGGFTGDDTGINILSTTYCTCQMLRIAGFTNFNNARYDGMQGTSMACPICAGVCGLLASAYPNITPAQAKNCLQSTAQSLASGSHQIDGNGYINAYAAVLCAQGLNGGGNSCGTPTGLTATAGSSSISLSWNAVSGANSYKVLRNGSQIGTSTTNSYTDNTAVANTSYTYTVKAVCSGGESSPSNGATATISGGGGGSTSCSYLHYPLPGDPTYIGVENDGGYVAGTNTYGDQAKAEYFTNTGNATITKMKIALAAATEDIGGSITFTIWANNGGSPGSVLGSKSVSFSDILSNMDPSTYEYECTFNSPINVNGNFFAGVDNSNVTGYYSLQTTADGSAIGQAWELYQGSWGTISSSWQGLNITMAIFPYLCGSVGIEDNAANNMEFMLYPNPASEYVDVILPETAHNTEIALYDVTGKLVKKQNTTENSVRINVYDLSQGLYFVKVGNTTKKFVKE